MSARPLAVVLHAASAERPDEADTIAQARSVAAALRRLGWRTKIKVLGDDPAALDALLRPRPAVVFNLVEALGGDGMGAHLAARELDRLGLPYTGSGDRAQRLTTAKTETKRILRAAGLPTPDWVEEGSGAIPPGQHERFIVKPASEDASLGLDAGSVVPAARVEAEILDRKARFGGPWFAEAFIDGREFNVGLLAGQAGLEVLPIAEILFVDYPEGRPHIVDYEAKWLEKSFAYSHTPRRFALPPADAALLSRLRGLALEACRLFDVRGYGRVDFRVDPLGRPWLLEVNTNPCLADDAGFLAAARQAGLAIDDVVARIVSAAGWERVRSVA